MKNRHIEIYKDVLRRHSQADKSFDVMLSGYYGFNNSGDDAILSAIIKSLRNEKQDISILVLSKNPKETAALNNVFSINRSNFYHILRFMKRSRLFLNGGGNLIQDITSTRSLVYYTTLMRFAKRFGLHVMLYANGIGPIIRKHNVKIARAALKTCDCITLRDPESIFELEKLGVKSEDVILSSDPTLVIKPVNETRLNEILTGEGVSKDKTYFTVSFRQWKYNDQNFVSKIADVINTVGKKHDMIPLFIPMQSPYDGIISREIISKLTVEHVILGKEYDVQELMGIIATTKFVIAMRLHTLIYAASVNVPFIGIVYDTKVKSFMEYVGQKTYVDGNEIDGKKLLTITDDILENYEDVKAAIQKESQKLKSLSNQDAKIAVGLVE